MSRVSKAIHKSCESRVVPIYATSDWLVYRHLSSRTKKANCEQLGSLSCHSRIQEIGWSLWFFASKTKEFIQIKFMNQWHQPLCGRFFVKKPKSNKICICLSIYYFKNILQGGTSLKHSYKLAHKKLRSSTWEVGVLNTPPYPACP